MKTLFDLIGMESFAGKKDVETEAVIYAHVDNPEGLGEALYKEHHEQLEADLGPKGRCRVRRITTKEDVKYEFTMKIPNVEAVGAGVKSSIEKNVLVTEDFYEAFRVVAKKMLRKTRFVFDGNVTCPTMGYSRSAPPPGVKYEVDVFETQAGVLCPWVKIDVELDALIKFMNESSTTTNLAGGQNLPVRLTFKVGHLPFKPSSPFLSAQATPEQKALLDELWESHFNLPVGWKNPKGEEAMFAGSAA